MNGSGKSLRDLGKSLLLRKVFMLVPLFLAVFLASGLQSANAACDCTDEATTGILQIECEALVALYTSTNGPSWTNNENWNTTSAVSGWYGVSSSGGHVAALQLDENGLSGTLPTEIGNFPNLFVLHLDSNQLTGAIPPEMNGLTSLQFLKLNSNQLEGEIPSQFGELSKLGVLALDQNRLTGGIPAELGMLSTLQNLSLQSNSLSGDIPPAIQGLTGLTTLKIGYNMLTASDPDTILFLDENSPGWADTQTVPPTNLSIDSADTNSVTLAWNPIAYTGDGGEYRVKYATSSGGPYADAGTTSGKAASSYTAAGLSPNRTYYFVVETVTPSHASNPNDLTSSLSQEISADTSVLCTDTQSTGIPQSECEALTAFYESTDGANWSIKSNWNTRTPAHSWSGVTVEAGHVTELSFFPNNLKGSIPESIGGLSELKTLRLFDNSLNGPIPSGIGELSELKMLMLARNQLDGSIPSELGGLMNLEELWLNENRLTGNIPAELGALSMLTRLQLESNRLEGPIPSQIGQLSNLTQIFLAFNQFSGDIPSEISNLSALTGGSIGYNMLTASSPDPATYLDNTFPGWAATQTVAPTNLAVGTVGPTSIQVTWDPIAYTGDGGYYRIHYGTTPGGPYPEMATAADKSASEYTVAGLLPDTPHYFIVESFTPAHSSQPNDLTSPPSAEISGTTDSPAAEGDADNSGTVDLADAILILQILADIDTGAAEITWSADASGDDRLGLEEAIFVLRLISQ
jgi:Leucine-rich repeat (LRR) protein